MSIRSAKRQIAKARMKALGIDRTNRRMRIDRGGGKIWRRVLTGDLAQKAEEAQLNHKRSRRTGGRA